MKAMILAAGRGQRMQPLTETTPKPLLPVGGRLLIDYHLHALAAAGIQDVVINVCYHANQIIQYLGDGHRYGLRIVFSHEQDGCLGTGGGIKKALQFLGDEPFILLSADIFTHFPLQTLLKTKLLDSFQTSPLNSSPTLAHLVLVDNPYYHSQGDFTLDHQGWLKLEGSNKLTYAGIGVISPKLFATAPIEAFSLSILFKQGINLQAVTGEHYLGFWDNIGTPEQLQALNQQLQNPRRIVNGAI